MIFGWKKRCRQLEAENAQLKAHTAQLEARLTESQAKNRAIDPGAGRRPKKLAQFIQTAFQRHCQTATQAAGER